MTRLMIWLCLTSFAPVLFAGPALAHVSEGGFGGAITAALYLQHFVSAETPWAHLDMMAWNNSTKPGRPRGGEIQAMRGAFQMLRRRYV